MNSYRYFQELCRRAASLNLLAANPREKEAIHFSLNNERAMSCYVRWSVLSLPGTSKFRREKNDQLSDRRNC